MHEQCSPTGLGIRLGERQASSEGGCVSDPLGIAAPLTLALSPGGGEGIGVLSGGSEDAVGPRPGRRRARGRGCGVRERRAVSSRKPDDLPAFCREIVRALAKTS